MQSREKTDRKKPSVNENYSSRLSKSNLFVQSSRKLQEMEENQYQEENIYGKWKLQRSMSLLAIWEKYKACKHH